MERGSLIVVSVRGEHGKPRPAVVIQSPSLEATESILVCLITSFIEEDAHHRVLIPVDPSTGLREPSMVMTEKIYPIPKIKCGPLIGRLPPAVMSQLDVRLAFVLGLGD
ncbi:MAG: type II toxin-antitoxin system PemK/MazF family toxin [Alphaproteobacteria bacterium]|nr:type II toxin-antitoxin system PemK/MazF family toxin [Alphaproteobacteria bacterium]MBU2380383.1 type II toxin-antitoxin system PemK/MazF family toxin [Alphaproteobacteria bacterium]